MAELRAPNQNHTRNPAFLGWHTGRRMSAATLRRCANVYFTARPFCRPAPRARSRCFKASGKGKLYSYSSIIARRRLHPPTRSAVVELMKARA